MQKPHPSLSPRANVLLIFAWAVLAAATFFITEPHAPLTLCIVGALLGALGGVMQHLSIREASARFTAASSLLEVRRAMKATLGGRRFIRFLWFSKLLLIVLAFVLVRRPWSGVLFGYLTGYFSLTFVREIITLLDTFFLHCLSNHPPDVT